MDDIEKKIREIEEEIRNTQKNKATEKHIGLLYAKMARLRKTAEEAKSKSGGGKGFSVRKEGDATVAMVGPPNAGKSTLLGKLTSAKSEIGNYEFTTLECVPGMLMHRGARIQVLDIPGIIRGASKGKGRGREVLSVIRSADLILVVVPADRTEDLEMIYRELNEIGVRPNRSPPDIEIRKKHGGGIEVLGPKRFYPKEGEDSVKGVVREFGMHNATVLFKEKAELNDLIDVLSGNRVYVPTLNVITKSDLGTGVVKVKHIKVSAEKGDGIEQLKDKIWEKLGFIRVYTKKRGEEPNMDEPIILRKGSTVKDACEKIHKGLGRLFRYALIWGKSARHPGQRVGMGHSLEDGDIICIISR